MWLYLWRLFGLVYLLSLLKTLVDVQFPERCRFAPHQTELYRRHCLEPHMVLDRVSLRVFVSLGEDRPGQLVWSLSNVSAREGLETVFSVPVPAEVRLGQRTLYGRVLVTDDDDEDQQALTVSFQFTQLLPGRGSSAGRSLLTDRVPAAGEGRGEERQHWKYGRHPLTLRLVRLESPLASPYLPALMELLPTSQRLRTLRDTGTGFLRTVQVRTYLPLAWVDDLALTRRQLAELARNTSMPDPECRFKLAPASLLHFAFKKSMRETTSWLSSFLGEAELDELRWWLSDDRIYRYFISQIIAVLHLVFEYLAFVDDWRFFVGRRSNRGLSVSSLVFSASRSLIFLLYLFDSDASYLVLASLAKDFAYTVWKIARVVRVRLTIQGRRIPTLTYDSATRNEEDCTASFDHIAYVHVILCLAPLVAGVALYSLRYYRYKSWWSWFISTLADSMYLFGFAAMCPQIYVNYKLKSVAHLPLRSLLYKAFITFVDDVFAFLVKMPLKHRIMTLRDDIVFAVFLYQWWIYPSDLDRTNEFGFQYRSVEPESFKQETG